MFSDYRPGTRHRPAGLKRPVSHKPRQPVCATGQASKLSADDVLQHFLVEAQIGDHLPQFAVLILKLFQPPHLGPQQATILALPVEVGRLANPGLPANIRNLHAVSSLLQNSE
jgi:hypothetical protein